MNLRLKLFVIIGSLFIAIALISYYLPQFLLNRDIEKLRETFDNAIIQHQQDDQQERKAAFLNRIQEDAYLLNADLYSVYDSSFFELINPHTNLSSYQLWRKAAKLMAYNPEVDLLQITRQDSGTIAIVPDNANIFSAKATDLANGVTNLEITRPLYTDTPTEKKHFLGVKIEIPPADRRFNISDELVLGELADFLRPSYYFLYDWDTLPQPPLLNASLTNFRKTHLKKAMADIWRPFRKRSISYGGSLGLSYGAQSIEVDPLVAYAISNTEKRFSIREEKTFLRRDLAEKFMGFLPTDTPFAEGAPVGIAKLTPQSVSEHKPTVGFALLSENIYFNHSLFDDASYYLKHSSNGKIPIASNLALINNSLLQNVYIGNTLAVKDDTLKPSLLNSLTLGSNLGPLLEDLATSSELVVFLTDGLNIRLAFNANGMSIPADAFKDFPIKEMIARTMDEVTVNGVIYDYFKIQPVNDSSNFILIIIPQSEEILYQFKNTMYTEMLAISHNISYQLLAVSLLCLGISLIILGFLSGRITRPIALLAKATQDVSKGHYSDIHLPHSKNRHDEIGVLSDSFTNMVVDLRDREKIRGVLNKVVSKEIAEEILKGNIHLGGEEKVISILFTDIRHFSKMTELLTPQVVINFLNAYMTKMSDIIEQEGGVIDKYVGDEIMALYGAPLPTPDNALRAIRTGLIMIETLRMWNIDRSSKGMPAVEIGIGIHTGIVVAGNMGAETRLNYTVLGANVNLASRLCMAAAPMQILITESTLNSLYVKETFIVEELPPILFKGFSEPIATYSVKGFR
jgi:class 3 adenylate cyclase